MRVLNSAIWVGLKTADGIDGDLFVRRRKLPRTTLFSPLGVLAGPSRIGVKHIEHIEAH